MTYDGIAAEADPENHQHTAAPALQSKGSVIHSTRKPVDLGNVVGLPVPRCPATKADVCIGPHVDRAVEAAGRHDEQGTFQLNARSCRSTVAAEALLMPS